MSENRKRPAAATKMNSGAEDLRNNESSISSTTGNGDANKRARESSRGGRRVSGNVVLGERNEELGAIGGDYVQIQPHPHPPVAVAFPPTGLVDQQHPPAQHDRNLRVLLNNEAPPTSVIPPSFHHHSNVLDLSSGPFGMNMNQLQGCGPFLPRPHEFIGPSILQRILNEKSTLRPEMPSVSRFFSRIPIPHQPPQLNLRSVRPFPNELRRGGPALITVRPPQVMMPAAGSVVTCAAPPGYPEIHHQLPLLRAAISNPNYSGVVNTSGFVPAPSHIPPAAPRPPQTLPLQLASSSSVVPVFPTPPGVSVDAISKDIGKEVPLHEGHHKVNTWLHWGVVEPSQQDNSGLREPLTSIDVQLTRFESTFAVSLSPSRVAYLNDVPLGIRKGSWLEIVRIVMDKVLDVNLTVYTSSELPTNELTFWNPFYRFDMLYRVAKCLVGGANTANLLRMSTAQSLLTLESTYYPPALDMTTDSQGVIKVLGEKAWSQFVIQILNAIFPERKSPDSPEHATAQPSTSLAIHNHLFSLFNPLALSLPSSNQQQQAGGGPGGDDEAAINYGRVPETQPPNTQPEFYRGPET